MATPRVIPYGSWKSPISPQVVASGAIGLDQILLDGDDVYWTELRAAEGGRYVVVRRMPDGRIADVTPQGFNARTRVHEYGGGAYTVHHGVVWFANFADQRLYRQDPAEAPRPITPAADLRYADMIADPGRRRLVCVREDHTSPGREATNTLVDLAWDGDEAGGRVLVAGNDFYSSPRLSPDGSRLAWLAWNHPNMPWDGTELWVGEVAADGSIARRERVAGGPSESIFQPEWSSSGTGPGAALYFVSDRTGWWNLYRWQGGRIEPLCEMEAEFGAAQWLFGMSTYAAVSPDRLLCVYKPREGSRLGDLDVRSRTLRSVDVPYTQIWALRRGAAGAAFVAGSPTELPSVVLLDPNTGRHEALRRSGELQIDPGYLSRPEEIEFPTEGGLPAYALFYRPQNRDCAGPPGERPPLIVRSHGGPTSAVSSTLNLAIQFWTSRGFAYLDVDYGGSTGYGRAYRERLYGQWGVVDVDDCVNGARHLADRGLVDGKRLIIHGGSAGGYTTLCALTFRDVFKAGASHFGISDLEVFRRDTHKFESRYDQHLIGPYPERRDLYHARSPIHFVDRISCPLILFQGLEDKIVPPNQAEMMFEAVRRKGIPVAYLAYEGEQHGFRRAENIARTLEAELYFYSRVFGFPLAESIAPVQIENLTP
jgi:dipeptidyl aminopeptidase/acylaminoacyl peptidase